MGKKLNKNMSELRFPEFDVDWKEYKLPQLFSISAGGDIDINKVKAEPDNIYKYPDICQCRKNKGLYGYSNEYKVEPNVIIIAGRGVNIGIAHARDHRFYPIVRLLVLKPKTGLNIDFFEYQINRMNVFVESTGVPQLTAPQVSSYKIFSTSIAEQEKIASFLGAVDTRLTQLRRKRDRLQTYKRGVMQKIFSQEIRFKDAIGSDFPDWEEKTLEEVVNFSKGKGISKDDLVESGLLKCIRYAELYTLYDEVIDHVISSTNLEPDNLVLSVENDVIIPASGESAIDIAKAACVKINGVALGGDLNILRTVINGIFLAHYLNHYKKTEIASTRGRKYADCSAS